MIREHDYEIDEIKFRITQLGARKQRSLLLKLFKILGPAFSGHMDDNVDQAISSGVRKMAFTLDEDEYENILNTLSSKCQVKMEDRGWVPLQEAKDIIFQGRLDLEIKFIIAALKENYASFLGGLPGIAEFAQEQMGSLKEE